MTKYGKQIVWLLKIAPYYFLLLAVSGFYTIYAESYPEFDWWVYYASLMIGLSLLSAIGIWYKKKWSIATVMLIILGMLYLQFQVVYSNYFMPIVLCFVIWALIESLYFEDSNEEKLNK